MERVFTKQVGRNEIGDVKDYPRSVWQQIAKSAGRTLASFSTEVSQAAKASATKGRKK